MGRQVPSRETANPRRRYVYGVEPCLIDGPPAPDYEAAIDPDAVLSSVGEVPYEWRLDTDLIVWGRSLGEVLAVRETAMIVTGAGFARLIVPESGRSRAEVVREPAFRGEGGGGVAYDLQYALRLPGRAEPTWVEDTGRWFAGPDGKPLRARGVVRVTNGRHEREPRLVQQSHLDALTGDMTRSPLTEVLAETIEDATT